MSQHRILRPWSLVVLFVLSSGCGGPAAEGPPPAVEYAKAPSWVHRGSGAFGEGERRAFYGVGIVQGIRNEALSRQTADNRARAEIAKIFDLYVAAMMKDYQRSTTAGDFQASAEEQDVVSAQKTITEVTLRGVEVRDHWVNPQSGALYALAVLDLDAMSRNLEGASALSARVRDHVRANAARAFEDLDRELNKRTGREPAGPAPAPEERPAPAPEPEPEAAPPPARPQAPPPATPARPARKLRVGLQITGTKASIIQTCFAERLTEVPGLELFEGTSDVDVLIRGQLQYEKAGENLGSQMVRADVNLRVLDQGDGKTLVALHEKIKVGRPTLETAVQNAITELCGKVVPQMVGKLRERAGR